MRTYDTFPQISPPPRTYETLSRHAAPSRALPPASTNSGDGLLSSLNEMKRAVRTAQVRRVLLGPEASEYVGGARFHRRQAAVAAAVGLLNRCRS